MHCYKASIWPRSCIVACKLQPLLFSCLQKHSRIPQGLPGKPLAFTGLVLERGLGWDGDTKIFPGVHSMWRLPKANTHPFSLILHSYLNGLQPQKQIICIYYTTSKSKAHHIIFSKYTIYNYIQITLSIHKYWPLSCILYYFFSYRIFFHPIPHMPIV